MAFGLTVSRSLRVLWETWYMHACPLHFSTHVYSAYLSIIFLLPLENQLQEVTISVIMESRTWNSG